MEKNKDKRKQIPLYTGLIKYFPNALCEVAKVSYVGNAQHNNPDQPIYWDRNKSKDDLDAMLRHLIEADKIDEDGLYHLAKVAWRSLAALERFLENEH
jgi:hypothetical protein